MKIGLPQALGYHYYSTFWKTFLVELGCTVLESGLSDREKLEWGAALTPSEACLPLKCFVGHVCSLEKKVDAVFIPRLVCMQGKPQTRFGCPKYIGLPDMVRALVPTARIFSPCLDQRIESDQRAFIRAAKEFGFNSSKARFAYCSAQKTASATSEKPDILSSASQNPDLRIGLLGHKYLVQDKHLSFGIQEKLQGLGCEVVDCSGFSGSAPLTQRPPVSWFFEEDILRLAEKLFCDTAIDGIIYLLSFGCGAGSITSEIVELEIRPSTRMPLLRIVIDEHTGEAGLMTRLESFIDMLHMGKTV